MKLLIKDVMLDGVVRDILINDGTIEDISAKSLHQADRVINGRNKVALPSFINGHTHAAMTLMRGYADDMPLKSWLEEKIWVLEAKLTEEDVYWGAKLACLEMIRNGITVFNDMYWHWEATAKAACEMGVRGFVSAVFIDMFDEKKSSGQIEHNIRLFEKCEKYKPHVTLTLGPHAIYTVSRQSLEWIRDFSQTKDLLVHMHLSETQEETRFSEEKYGLSPVEFLDSTGVLSDRFIGCHGCFLDEKDCDIIRKRHSKLVNVPVSNLKLAVGRVFPYSLIKKAGIPFCFGTDGCASNNHLDIIETMKFASLLAKFLSRDPTTLPARETFRVATEAAANIFRLPGWEIKVGDSPDIILIDLARPELSPNFNIYSNMVYASNGYVTDTVICMGKVLMENRHVKGEEEIVEKARKVAAQLVER